MIFIFRGLLYLSVVSVVGCGDLSMPDGGSSRANEGHGTGQSGSNEVQLDLTQCGFDLSSPQQIIGSRRMGMVPKLVSIPRLLWTDTVTIKGSAIFEESLERSVITYAAQPSPASTAEQVTTALKPLRSGFSADLLKLDQRAKIGLLHEDWKGVFCTLQPAVRLEHGLSDKIVVTFDKPLPISPLMVADRQRLLAELGIERAWDGITAKVVESLNSDVAVGTVWTGKAILSKVPAVTDIDGSDGKVSIQADVAVKLSYDFGSPSINQSMGLPAAMTWYMDTAAKGFKLLQVDFGDGQLVNYLPQP